MALTGEIRMIRWGLFPSPSPGYTISVGKKVGGDQNLLVKAIVSYVSESSDVVFDIECVPLNNKNEEGEPFVWKTYYKVPDEITYFIPDEKHNYKTV